MLCCTFRSVVSKHKSVLCRWHRFSLKFLYKMDNCIFRSQVVLIFLLLHALKCMYMFFCFLFFTAGCVVIGERKNEWPFSKITNSNPNQCKWIVKEHNGCFNIYFIYNVRVNVLVVLCLILYNLQYSVNTVIKKKIKKQ